MPVTVNHRASVVCPRALVADLELRLAAAAQRHNRVSYHMASLGNDQHSKCRFYGMHSARLHCHTVKKS